MTFQTYSLFVLSVILCCFGHVENRLNLHQLQNDIDKLKADFNSSHSDVADGGPIFTGRLSSWTERNEKRIILSQILSMYLKMFENTDKTKAHVRNISEELYTLKESLSDGSKKAEDLKDLTKLQMTDLKIQRKAVSELFSVLQKLGDVSSSHNRQRRQFQRRCRC
ncbi:PREDICTED: interferon gamma [Acanthisitta chloris]|uniref:Interferon gamma n=1 Tax=Acanthisitta chloris TaxID=57068 RepID=A0A091NCJ7_9PASS|nr:PREDICTED: interferon gamma [Acanthisitta chloris]KFP87176.1 Interferon gamma [Acanthisitta chloris]